MEGLSPGFDKIELYVTRKISEQSDTMVYHNIKFLNRLKKHINTIADSESLIEKEREMVLLGGMLGLVSLSEFKPVKDLKFKKNWKKIETWFDESASQLLKKYDYSDEEIEVVKKISISYGLIGRDVDRLPRVLLDAFSMDFINGNGKKRIKLFYQETLLRGITVSKTNWYDAAIEILKSSRCYTKYGETNILPKIADLTIELEKEKKQLEKKQDLLLKRELDISDEEFKALKKGFKEKGKKDERGIQTLFRTTSKNHYTLNEMVDRKASIMITVNSIILSVMVSGFVAKVANSTSYYILPILSMTITALLSIWFAILAIRPSSTHGVFTEEEIRNKKGNILYFGNFHGMHERDFEWAMLQMMNDGDYLYSSIIKDIYHMGRNLDKKYKYIRRSLNSFMIGLILAVVLMVVSHILDHHI